MEANGFMNNSKSLKQLLKEESQWQNKGVVTFSQNFDKLFGGQGIQYGQILEVYGDKGVGKTTLCMQLSLNVQIPRRLQGLESKSLFIDVEGTFVYKRVKQMAEHLSHHCKILGEKIQPMDLLKSIKYLKCSDPEQFMDILKSLKVYLKQDPSIKLVAIDSLSFLYYPECENFRDLYKIGQILNDMVHENDVIVITTSNLTTRFAEEGQEEFVPYLGESWQHIPNQRIRLYWKQKVRTAELIKSSWNECCKINFKVTPGGIRD